MSDRPPALEGLGKLLSNREVPYVAQQSATDCGAACVAMALAYHGRPTRLEEVRRVMGIGRDGASALAIIDGAVSFELRARGIKIDAAGLDHLPPGTVLHWEMKHFVVLDRIDKRGVHLVDPGVGRRVMSRADVNKAFTGVAILLEPTERFTSRPRGKRPVWTLVRRALAERGAWVRVVTTSVLLQLVAVLVPFVNGELIDRAIPRADYHLLLVLGLAVAALGVFQLVSSLVRAHLLLAVRTVFDGKMTLAFLEHLLSLPYSFFQSRASGDLMMRLNSNATIREILTGAALSAVLDGGFGLAYLVLLTILSPIYAAVALGLALLHCLTFLATRRRQRELLVESHKRQAESESYLVEMLEGVETLKVLGSEHRAAERWSNLHVDVLNISLRRGAISAVSDAMASSLRLLSPIVLLFLGTYLVLGGSMTVGSMLAVNALAMGFVTPVASIVSSLGQMQLVGTYLDRIDDVLATAPEQDGSVVRAAPRLNGEIALEKVSFRYAENAPLVVDDVSVSIPAGTFVAIVGRSGSGKSSLANLLVGMYAPTSGRIRYDGVDLGSVDLRSLRRQLGIVPQRPYVFGGTVRDNIALVDPTLPLHAVIAAAERACIHEDIAALPLGYDTPLPAAGASLSGGQRQRLALARALVRRPPVLLLDEATSALDAITERAVQRELETLGCTRVVIAHRLSTVEHADLILVMDEGRIVESGRHAALLRRGGAYAELVRSQMGARGARGPAERVRPWPPEHGSVTRIDPRRAAGSRGAR